MGLPARPTAAALIALGLILAATTAARTQQSHLAALPETALAPPDNPTTPDKVALGRLLFWDPILSGPRDVACATCHHPDFGYAEPLDLSIGIDGVGLGRTRQFAPGSTTPHVKRNSQTILNTAFNGMDDRGQYQPALAPMFWDRRVESLETQALQPIMTLEEMRGPTYDEADALPAVVARLSANAEYRALFTRAFGTPDAVTVENLGRALAAFERTLVAANSPFDRYMRGDANAMTPAEVRGMRAFEDAGCTGCHRGPMFSDFRVHVLGIADNRKLAEPDTGVEGLYAFRTPSLRNLAFTAPYMHNGVFADLDDVLDFYDNPTRGRGRRGGSRNPNVSRGQLDPLLLDLNVRNERSIEAFLGALNDDTFDRTIPDRVPSGLPPGGRIGPPPPGATAGPVADRARAN